MRFNIPEDIRTVLACLREAGFRAVPVGGCVRDLLLGHTPHDWDIATSATPDEMLAVFSAFRALKLGQSAAKHGTVTVMSGHSPVEVTTFRQDGHYSDGRRPDSVRFSRVLAEDLARRDFTINAMCLGEDGAIIDLFGGRGDLTAGIIRAIGTPDLRFGEDALRILRALRFAAALGFVIELQTADSMLRHVGGLAALSAERVRAELEKLLCAPGCTQVLLEYREVILAVMPELRPLSGGTECATGQGHDAYTRAARAVGAAPPAIPVRLALLLNDSEIKNFCDGATQSATLADRVLRRLKFSNVVRERTLFLLRHRDLPLCAADRIAIKKLLLKYGADALGDLLAVQRADMTVQPDKGRCRLAELEAAQRLLQDILSRQPLLHRTQLAVSGKELILAGIAPGPGLGALLELLLQKVLEEVLPNEAGALLEYAAVHRDKGADTMV